MRRLLTGLFIGWSLLAVPGSASAAEPVFAGDGTVGLVPPEGMVESREVRGFEDRAAKVAIIVVEMPPPAFEQVRESLTDESLAQKGVTIQSRRDLTLADGTKALLLSGSQNIGAANIKKWILIAAGEHSTALITAQAPEESAGRYPDSVVEAALRSVVFRAPPTTEELLAKLPFRVEALDGYRVLKVLGPTAVLLTKGPLDTIESGDQPYFIVILSPADIREEDRESYAKRAIAAVPGVRELRVERGGPLRIGGQPGFELIASAADAKSGKPVKVAQWLRFGRTTVVRMVGVLPGEGQEGNFDALRAMRDEVEMR